MIPETPRDTKLSSTSRPCATAINRRAGLAAGLTLFIELAGISAKAETANDPLVDTFAGGTPSLELRPRYHFVRQDGKRGADALTNRTLFGYATKPIDGLGLTVQFINVANIAGTHNDVFNGKKAFAIIPDPNATDVNQAFANYDGLPDTSVKIGRQIIVLDDSRFVGNVDFRQNMQTFDALSVASKSLPQVTLFGSYVWGIKNVVGRRVTAKTYLAEASWTPISELQVDGFGYWYGNEAHAVIPGAATCFLDGVSACNSGTFGTRAHGNVPLSEDFYMSYRATYARQMPYDNGSSKIDASYCDFNLRAGWNGIFAALDYTRMGSNDSGTYGFQTPLATKHAYNGAAEIFLTTPPEGLQSGYVTLGTTVFGGTAYARYFRFRSDFENRRFGNELDLSVAYPFLSHYSAVVEYADYRAHGFATDTQAMSVYLTAHY